MTLALTSDPSDRSHPPATRPTSAPVPAALDSAPNPDEETVARQKAAFVGQVWRLAQTQKLALQHACPIVAARSADFPALTTAGKGGRNLLRQSSAYANYRSWSGKLGRLDNSRKPDIDNWRSLLPRYRSAKQYVRPGPEAFWTILANLYEHPNQLALRYAYKLACMAWQRSNPSSLPSLPSVRSSAPPSYDQVRHYYDRHADHKAVLIARQGEDWFRNNIVDYIDRAAPRIDEVWFSDHHIFDAAVRVWDPDAGKWAPVRPWLTAWLDWGSLFFTGFQIRTIAPNRDAIERALRSGIEKNDLLAPLHVYIDNGKDYRALGFAKPLLSDSDIPRLRSVAGALGCQVHFAEAYNARAKVIERIFGTVCGQFSKLWSSYRGSKPESRPQQAHYYWTHPEQLPTLSEFIAAFERWLAIVYHSTPSGGKILAGKAPLDARKDIQPLRPRLEPSSLYRAFLRELPRPRTIQRGGLIRALNRLYRSDQLYSLLKPGAQVRVKVDVDNLDVAWIYTLDGREIGPASAKPLLAPVPDGRPETIEQLREEKRRQARQLKAAKQASAARRDMSRWLNKPPTAPVTAFLGPHQSPSPLGGEGRGEGPLSSPSLRPSLPSVSPSALPSNPALLAELDAAIREQSAAALADQSDDIADEDLALLAEIEAQQTERIPTYDL